MRRNYPHGTLIERKISNGEVDSILLDLSQKYKLWSELSGVLNSENNNELEKKVCALNEYKNFVDELTYNKYFIMQDKMSSSIMEEFLFYLFKDIPSIKSNMSEGLIYMGSANAYTDLSFAPKNLKDFLTYPNIFINYKNQDFTISKLIKCLFECNGCQEYREIIVPTVAVECKTFIPSTMLGQSIYEAQLLKQGNPYSLYIVVAEQNALSDDVNLKNIKNIPIDEIFILRKQKRNSMKNKISDKKPIDYQVIKELYDFVKDYLNKEWFNNQKATERGRLIRF
ncbi:MAG: Bpu10I family restriction endonuclease [Treponema sp.]|jgi:hypothetical protein|nr:Bpu10I family restriction endonuclease [Treponema sp.]